MNRACLAAAVALCLLTSAAQAQRPPMRPTILRRADVVVADFEGKDYGRWTATGTAFGPGPAQGTLPGQMPVTGFKGHGLANSFYGGDKSLGTLTSPPFRITRRFINFRIGGGGYAGVTCLNLLVGNKVVRTATGPNIAPGGSERLDRETWNVADLEGKTARIEIVDKATGGWGHINVDDIVMSDERAAREIKTAPLYGETYRPQFHFTAQTNWLNDPNGLVYYAGEYHLFFQRNASGMTSNGIMTWGHAVSPDLVHWQEIADALTPDLLGPMWSGSAIVDADNTAGFQQGPEKTLVAVYTAAGGVSPESKGQPFTQCLAYSRDRGRTWTKYANNPVLGHIVGGNRDPKIAWHAPTKRWIMALYLDKEDYGLFSSPDLKNWTPTQTLTVPGCSECPDFFEMGVEGHPDQRRWVFTGANGHYLVGAFDGATFTPETPAPLPEDWGANYYAVQTFSDIPPGDGRRIQIAWMNGGVYPKMPFNQQMSFPCELTLHATPEGLRLYRWPVREIETLREKGRILRDIALPPGGENPLHDLTGDLWDIEMSVDPGNAAAFGVRIGGEDIRYSVAEQSVSCLGRQAHLAPQNHRVTLRLLVDRTSLELYGNDGQVSMTSCFLPDSPDSSGLTLYAEGGTARIESLAVYPLRSAWPAPQASHLPASR